MKSKLLIFSLCLCIIASGAVFLSACGKEERTDVALDGCIENVYQDYSGDLRVEFAEVGFTYTNFNELEYAVVGENEEPSIWYKIGDNWACDNKDGYLWCYGQGKNGRPGNLSNYVNQNVKFCLRLAETKQYKASPYISYVFENVGQPSTWLNQDEVLSTIKTEEKYADSVIPDGTLAYILNYDREGEVSISFRVYGEYGWNYPEYNLQHRVLTAEENKLTNNGADLSKIDFESTKGNGYPQWENGQHYFTYENADYDGIGTINCVFRFIRRGNGMNGIMNLASKSFLVKITLNYAE